MDVMLDSVDLHGPADLTLLRIERLFLIGTVRMMLSLLNHTTTPSLERTAYDIGKAALVALVKEPPHAG